MTFSKSRALSGLLPLFVSALAWGQQSPDDDALEKLKTEAVPYWQNATTEFLGQMAGTCQVNTHYAAQISHNVVHQASDEMKSIYYIVDEKDRSIKVVPTYDRDPAFKSAFVANPDYQFRVQNDGGSSRYKLTSYVLGGKTDADFFNQFNTVPSIARQPIFRLLGAEAFNGLRIDQLVAGQGGHKITAARFVETDAGRRCRIEFDFPPPPPNNPVSHGVAVLDPADHWAIESWEEIAPTWRWSIANTFQATPSGMPFPKTSTETSTRLSDGVVLLKITTTFDMPQFRRVAASKADFTLPAYDLRVPGSVSGSSKLIMISVASLLTLGFAFAIFSRRKGRRSAAS